MERGPAAIGIPSTTNSGTSWSTPRATVRRAQTRTGTTRAHTSPLWRLWWGDQPVPINFGEKLEHQQIKDGVDEIFEEHFALAELVNFPDTALRHVMAQQRRGRAWHNSVEALAYGAKEGVLHLFRQLFCFLHEHPIGPQQLTYEGKDLSDLVRVEGLGVNILAPARKKGGQNRRAIDVGGKHSYH